MIIDEKSTRLGFTILYDPLTQSSIGTKWKTAAFFGWQDLYQDLLWEFYRAGFTIALTIRSLDRYSLT